MTESTSTEVSIWNGCEGILKSGNPCFRKPKDGYKLCGYCISALKRNPFPPAKRKIAEIEVEVESRRMLRQLMEQNKVDIEVPEFDKDFNPFDALLQVAQEQMAWKELCLAKLAKLKEDEWRWDGDRAGEQLRSEVTLYERSIKEATDLLIKISRLGIEERLMRIAERQQQIVETAIVRTMQDLDLPLDIQVKARKHIILHLRNG